MAKCHDSNAMIRAIRVPIAQGHPWPRGRVPSRPMEVRWHDEEYILALLANSSDFSRMVGQIDESWIVGQIQRGCCIHASINRITVSRLAFGSQRCRCTSNPSTPSLLGVYGNRPNVTIAKGVTSRPTRAGYPQRIAALGLQVQIKMRM